MNPLPVDPNLTRTVLVVEDESRLCDMLLRAIPEMGFDAVGAGSGEEAMKIIAQRQIGIVILDLNLPGMDGLTFFNRIRERDRAIQVVILTGFGDLEAARTSIRLGVADFLSKPCTLGDLERALDRAWKRRLAADNPLPQKPVLRAIAIQAEAEPEDAPADEEASPKRLRDVEREHILAALSRHEGNRAKAARELGISTRTLYYRLAEYGHDVPPQ